MISEVGTLKELNLKEGEVVECITSYSKWTVGKHYKAIKIHGEIYLQSDQQPQQISVSTFKRVSSPPPKTWGELSDVEKGELLLAAYQKKTIEVWISAAKKWFSCGSHIIRCFNNDGVYRIKPEPVVTEHVGVVYAGNEQRTTTYQTVDGKMDWSTFKVNDK